jgi:hypothetical protein
MQNIEIFIQGPITELSIFSVPDDHQIDLEGFIRGWVKRFDKELDFRRIQ